jgi:hypothetical protein
MQDNKTHDLDVLTILVMPPAVLTPASFLVPISYKILLFPSLFF